jgi:hypothetical protein
MTNETERPQKHAQPASKGQHQNARPFENTLAKVALGIAALGVVASFGQWWTYYHQWAVMREQLADARAAAKTSDKTTAATLEQFTRSADAAEKASNAAKAVAENAAAGLDETRRSNKTSAASLAEMRHANRDATRARLEFVDASVEAPDQIDDPRVFFVTIVNSGHSIAPWYVAERSCVDYSAAMPTTIPCPERLGPKPGRKAVPLSWGAGQPSAAGQVAKRLAVGSWVHERSPDELTAYLAGRINVYWFVTIRYADGLGGMWRRKGCWYLTKWDEENAMVGGRGAHFIFSCDGFPREREITGSTAHATN